MNTRKKSYLHKSYSLFPQTVKKLDEIVRIMKKTLHGYCLSHGVAEGIDLLYEKVKGNKDV